MSKSISVLKRSVLVGTAFMLVGGLVPVSAYADDPSSTTCTAPTSSQAGVHKPVGADASTYTYNCKTGLWENGYYAYDPATGLTTPTYPVVYTYNASTGLYDTTIWTYNAPHSTFTASTQSVAQPPAGADVVGGPAPVVSPSSTANNNSGTPGTSGSTGTSGTSSSSDGPNANGIDTTGPDSSNAIDGSDNNNLTLNNQNSLGVTNGISQLGTSGDSLVSGNTTGGSATSGDVINETELANELQSTSNALGGNTTTFVANVDGDVSGDLLFDPASLSSIQNAGPASTNTTASNTNNNLNVNNSTGASINNNVNLSANSGDATVSGNSDGGNATSGNAENMVGIVNMIDSMITAGQSFIGTININGNLNGNILLPANLVSQLLADNVPTVNVTGPSSNNSSATNVNNNAVVTNTNNQGINNNVTATAASGNATVSDNTQGGNATSGDAGNSLSSTNTTITAFNLTGSQVLGANDILVFVNVTGQWIGLIVGAPAGTTAAEFGGGITSSGPNSENSTATNVNNNATTNNNTNQQINNNINTAAQSGNATVSGNTIGGSATSGSAKNAINLANVENSTINLTGWFGILFINVFGSWHGNFGVEPSPGNFVATSTSTTSDGTTSKGTSAVPAAMQVFGFISQNGSTTNFAGGSTSGGDNTGTNGTVLAAQHSKGNGTPTPQLQNTAHRNLLLPIASVLLFVVYIVGDRAYTLRKRQIKSSTEHAGNIHQAQAL